MRLSIRPIFYDATKRLESLVRELDVDSPVDFYVTIGAIESLSSRLRREVELLAQEEYNA